MNRDLYALEDLIIRLQCSPIVGYSYSQNTLRLQIKTPVATLLLPDSEKLNLVLWGCSKLYYLSYTQTQENRIAQENSEIFFGNGLQIQGLQLKSRAQADTAANESFTMYCNSYLHTLEAGELHFNTQGFQLYDQEFGVIDMEDFKRAAGKLKANF